MSHSKKRMGHCYNRLRGTLQNVVMSVLACVLLSWALPAVAEAIAASCVESAVLSNSESNLRPAESSVTDILLQMQREEVAAGTNEPIWNLSNAIIGRITRDDVSENELREILQQVARGDKHARPWSIEWDVKYSDILDAYYTAHAYDADRELSLRDLPMRVKIVPPRLMTLDSVRSWRATTPSFLEIKFWTFQRRDRNEFAVVQAQMYINGKVVASERRGASGPVYLPFPALDRGEHMIVVLVEVGHICPSSQRFLPSKREIVSTNIEIGDEPDEVQGGIFSVAALKSERIDDLLRERCVVTLQPLFDDVLESRLFRVNVTWDMTTGPLRENWAVVGLLEMIRDGEVIGRAPVAIFPGPTVTWIGDPEVIVLDSAANGEISEVGAIQARLISSRAIGNSAYVSLAIDGLPIWDGRVNLSVTHGEPIRFRE